LKFLSKPYASLKGWYIPDEPALAAWTMPSLTYSYYAEVVSAIKQHSPLPVLVSPYLVGVKDMTPQELAARAKDFQAQTHVDIQVWQDSVGAAAINVYNRTGEYSLADYFSAISSAIGKQHLWSDIEAFSYGASLFESGGYTPCSATRLSQQIISTSPYVSKSMTWIQQFHFGTVSDGAMPESRRLLSAYQSSLFGGQVLYITPISYTWITEPTKYIDTPVPSKMFDKKTGDPLSYLDTKWVGFLGNAIVEIDIGTNHLVGWVAVHVLNYNAGGIRFPLHLQVQWSNDHQLWYDFPAASLRFSNRLDGEYVMSNLGHFYHPPSVRHLRVSLLNSYFYDWTFVSEIEIVGFSYEI